jgi:micrococcal nuclease|tara:strand:+ start:187 stop:540 length:354 start_codon:yes stop_codon:yes gene_type:complete
MYTYKAKLDRIIDGDTVDAHIDLGFDITIHKRIRLAGIDTPESRTRDLEEKAKGLAAKARLEELLEEKNFVLESKEVGKYGRVLGTLHTYPEGNLPVNVNETLVKEGYAVEYNGGKK